MATERTAINKSLCAMSSDLKALRAIRRIIAVLSSSRWIVSICRRIVAVVALCSASPQLVMISHPAPRLTSISIRIGRRGRFIASDRAATSEMYEGDPMTQHSLSPKLER